MSSRRAVLSRPTVTKGFEGLWLVEEAEKGHSFLTQEKETAELWHCHFRHAGFESLAKLAEGKLAIGVEVSSKTSGDL
jgi:hypothetical protein